METTENIKAKARYVYLTAEAEKNLHYIRSVSEKDKSTSGIIQEGIKLVKESLELKTNEQN